jgi:hypothetical protein
MITMFRIAIIIAVVLQSISVASGERIKRKPPDDAELARIASDQAMNDGDLRIGDIIATHRGFLQLRGVNADGSYDFWPVPDPLKHAPKNR